MNLAYRKQKFQDWFTQQWVILWGRKFNPLDEDWLIAPFGELQGIGEDFINQLAEKENLVIKEDVYSEGLLKSITELEIIGIERLSVKVIDFYERTSDYDLKLKVKWNPIFKFFGYLVNRLFAKRIKQLNIPLQNFNNNQLSSQIIQLVDQKTNQVKYTIWLRKLKHSREVIYSGIYSTCRLPSSNKIGIKAVFPLPRGNATVIMNPNVGKHNELILDSSGNEFGDAGFYFLLNDSENKFWAKFISCFTDRLSVSESKGSIIAHQVLKLWHIKVVEFYYKITER